MPHAFPSVLRFSLLVLAVLALGGRSWALDASKNPAAESDDADIEEKYITKVLEDAARYRLERSRHHPDAAYDAAAQAYLDQGRAVLADGRPQPLERFSHWLSPQWWLATPSKSRRAGWLGADGFADYPYSAAAGDLLALEIDSYAERGNIYELHGALFRLWFYLPDYAGMGRIMETALAAAERVQDFNAAVHLESSDPSEVIRISGSSTLQEVKKLFRFLVLHGDRESVAPRAALGLARALLRSGDKDELLQARREYERFCETYPSHPLVFTALCERALSYLVSYKGEQYDVGVLISAAVIIDQAEIESRGKPDNIRQVELYRARIRSWHQDRDLEVARWYRDRVLPGLGWLTCPGDINASWEVAARYYYREVIRRDSGSDQARAARRELEALTPPTPTELGTELPAPAAPKP